MTEERLAVAETRIAALEQRMLDGFQSRDKALDVALKSLNEHLLVMNEFRGAMSDQAAKFITRAEHEDLKYRSASFITRAEHEQLMGQITQQALDARSIAIEYVPRVDMVIMATRMENCEKAQAQMQARYAMVALVFSTMVVIANLIAVWWHQIFS